MSAANEKAFVTIMSIRKRVFHIEGIHYLPVPACSGITALAIIREGSGCPQVICEQDGLTLVGRAFLEGFAAALTFEAVRPLMAQIREEIKTFEETFDYSIFKDADGPLSGGGL